MIKRLQSVWLGICLVALALAVASCGFPGLSDPVNDGGNGETLPLSLELIAGDISGPGTAARFNIPFGVVVDSVGNLYVADTGNHTIRKITADGVATTLAGTAGMVGSADGTGAAARFNNPASLALDSAGNLYVADYENHTIRKITAAGVVTTLAGTAGMTGSTDGTGSTARFNRPAGVVVDSSGNVYVADQNNSTIRKITPAGGVTTLGGTAGIPGGADGTGTAARFSGPTGLAVDSAGNLYVADQANYTIRKVTTAGVVTTLVGTADISGSTDGTGAAARFNGPAGVAVDSTGNVYVADTFNHTIRKVNTTGGVTTLAGTAGIPGSADGTGVAARFNKPTGVVVDRAGNIYVADYGNSLIRKFTAAGVVTTLAGATNPGGSADGTGAVARFNSPAGVAVDNAGNVYVADYGNSTMRKVTPAGFVTTLAGTAGMAGSADGTGTAARFHNPTAVAIDSAGNMYVADYGNSTIRKSTAAGVVTTLAGATGILGSADGTGAAARFYAPSGVAVDSAGNVYVADYGSIRKVTAAGVVTTLAGAAGIAGSVDGTGAAARFNNPTSVAVDSAGNVYVADYGNSTIRKVTAAGVVTTLAGTAGRLGSADGAAAALFNFPIGLAVDSSGNVYVADANNATIRKVTPTGITTTIAGTASISGILLGATPRFASPRRLVVIGDSLVVSDANAILLLRHGAQ